MAAHAAVSQPSSAMNGTRPGGFRPASTRQPFRPTTRQVPPRKAAAAQPKQQEEQPMISDEDDNSEIDEDVENRIPQRMLASIEEASSPTPSPKKAASSKTVPLSLPVQSSPSPFKARQTTAICASPAPSSSSQRDSFSRPSSSAGTAFSDMETDVEADEGPSNAVASSSALASSSSVSDSGTDDAEKEDHDRTRTQFTRNAARASSSSSSPPPRVFFGTPSSSEKEQRRRYSTRIRERRLLRRDSLELARRKTLTLEEVEEAARVVREERERKAREEEEATAVSGEEPTEAAVERSQEHGPQEAAPELEKSRRPSASGLNLAAEGAEDALPEAVHVEAQQEATPSTSCVSLTLDESATTEVRPSQQELQLPPTASPAADEAQVEEPAEASISDGSSSATQEPIEAQSPAAIVAPAFDETLALESLEGRFTPAKRTLPGVATTQAPPAFDETVAFDQIESEAVRAAEVPLKAEDVLDQTLSIGVMEAAVASAPTQLNHFDETLALDRVEDDAEADRRSQAPTFDSPAIDDQLPLAEASPRRPYPAVYALPSFDETLALDVLEDAAEDDVAAAYEEDFASGTVVRSVSLPCKGFLDETLALEDLEDWETEEVEAIEGGEEVETPELDEAVLEEEKEAPEQSLTAATPTPEATSEEAGTDGEAAAEHPVHSEASEQPPAEDQPALNAGVASASASFMLDSPGVGLARAGRDGTPTRAVLAEMRQQATGSAVRRLFPHIPNDYHEILGKTDGTPAPPRSPAMKVTPLGEKDTNASWNTRAVRLTPTPSKQPSTPRSHAKRPQTPVAAEKEADEAAAHPFSPEMDRLRAARDAILAAAPPSPDKSPKKASRVAVPSPMKKSGDGEPSATEADENRSPVKSPLRSFGRTVNFWQALKQPGEEGVGSNAVPLPTSPLKASASPSKPRAGAQEELTKGPASAQKQPSKPSGSSVKPAATTTRLPKPATATATTSRLAKPKPVSSGIRPPTSVAAKPQAAVATTSVPVSTASIRKPLSSRLPMQSSTRPTSADSASSSSSSAAAAKDTAAMAKLKDPRRPVKPEGTTSVRRAPISALRKLQATSDGNPFAPKSSLPPTTDGGIDWLASSGGGTVSGRASPEKPMPTMAAPSPRKPSPPMEAAAPAQLSSASPSRLKINLSPVKLARSAGPGGAARARRVPVGSREATHAPEPLVASATTATGPSTSSLRTSKSSNGSSSSSSASSARPAPHVNFHATTPILQRSAGASRKLAASSGSSSSSSPDRPVASSSTRERSSSSSNGSSKTTQRGSTREAAESEAEEPFGSSSSSERAGSSKRTTSSSAPAPKQASSTAGSSAPSSSSSSSFAGPRASRVGKTDHVPSVPISSAALDALTTRNSRKNEAYYAKLDVVVVRVEGPRPPSPSSKIRKSASASAGARRMGKEQAKRARADRAKKRAAGEGEGEDEEGEEENAANMSAAKALELGQHRLGAGEADVYATPPKVRAGAKGVRWHKALYAGPSEAPREQIAQGGGVGDYDEVIARRGAHRLRGAGPPRLVARDYGLDRHGNVRMALEAPPSPRWTRVKVTIRKIIYEDDDEEEESEEESGEEGEAW